MRYLLHTNTGYEHLAKKSEQAVLTHVGRDSSEITVCLRSFFVRKRLLANENGLYELANTFCHVALICLELFICFVDTNANTYFILVKNKSLFLSFDKNKTVKNKKIDTYHQKMQIINCSNYSIYMVTFSACFFGLGSKKKGKK